MQQRHDDPVAWMTSTHRNSTQTRASSISITRHFCFLPPPPCPENGHGRADTDTSALRYNGQLQRRVTTEALATWTAPDAQTEHTMVNMDTDAGTEERQQRKSKTVLGDGYFAIPAIALQPEHAHSHRRQKIQRTQTRQTQWTGSPKPLSTKKENPMLTLSGNMCYERYKLNEACSSAHWMRTKHKEPTNKGTKVDNSEGWALLNDRRRWI